MHTWRGIRGLPHVHPIIVIKTIADDNALTLPKDPSVKHFPKFVTPSQNLPKNLKSLNPEFKQQKL